MICGSSDEPSKNRHCRRQLPQNISGWSKSEKEGFSRRKVSSSVQRFGKPDNRIFSASSTSQEANRRPKSGQRGSFAPSVQQKNSGATSRQVVETGVSGQQPCKTKRPTDFHLFIPEVGLHRDSSLQLCSTFFSQIHVHRTSIFYLLLGN